MTTHEHRTPCTNQSHDAERTSGTESPLGATPVGGESRPRRVDERVARFLSGHLTLAELEGVPKSDQYEMAGVGYTLFSEGRLAAADRIFRGLHALDPYDAYFLTALGSIAQQQNRLDDAEGHYTRALEINPFSIAARAHRAEVRVLAGRVEEAVTDLERVAREDPAGSDPAARRAAAVAQVVRQQLEIQTSS